MRSLTLQNTAIDPHGLEAAFAEFNVQSGLLEECYRSLQERIDGLTRRLAEAHSARHRELLEKERLGNRLSRLLETLPGAFLVIDGDGVILEQNSRATELLQQPLLGLCWADVVQREFQPCERVDGDLELKDGRWVNLFRRPLDKESGEILLLTDVTESRRMSKLLERQERLSALGEMTASLAHQIRTPLSSAMLYLSGVAGDEKNAGGDAIGPALDCLRRLDGLVTDTLSFARGADADGDRIDVADLLRSVLETITPQLDGDSSVTVDFEQLNLEVTGNRDALHGALLNLVTNALEAGTRPMVEICAAEVGEQVWLIVRDDGDGFDNATKALLFDPFFTTRKRGTGLGLSIVRSVAEAHGGDVVVDCGELGTTFAICLPRERGADLLPGGHRTSRLEVEGSAHA